MQNVPKPLAQADGADDNLFERFVDWRICIRVEKPPLVASKDAAMGQQLQFPLHRSRAAPGSAHDFAKVEGFVRAQESQRQNGLTSASEEDGAGVARRNHIGDNRTYFGCTWEEDVITHFGSVSAQTIFTAIAGNFPCRNASKKTAAASASNLCFLDLRVIFSPPRLRSMRSCSA